MPRARKEQPTASSLPDEISNSLQYVQKRFQFNIDQIEKRYGRNSSGLIFNLKNDEIEFDPEECTAHNEADLLDNVKKQFHKHSLEPYGGTALLSTPAEDLFEKNPMKISGWKKLNKLYDAFLRRSQENRVVVSNIKRQVKFEPVMETFKYNPADIFPRLIKQEAVSVAESHQIDEPIILPLMPIFCTPRGYNAVNRANNTPMTRAQKRMLTIEQNYDNRKDRIYRSGSDWVENWVNDIVKREVDPPKHLIKRCKKELM